MSDERRPAPTRRYRIPGPVALLGLRTAALAAVVALQLVIGAAMVLSYLGNRAVAARTLRAAEDVATVRAADRAGPTLPELHKLDALREQLESVERYERAGAPMGLRFGPSRRTELRSLAYETYFARFSALLERPARQSLIARLASVPPVPDPSMDFQGTYDRLRAYLILTEYPDSSTSEALTGVLTSAWLSDRVVDPALEDLVEGQFDYYSRQLPFGTNVSPPADAALVDRVRAVLRESYGIESVYAGVVRELSNALPPARLEDVEGADGYLTSRTSVPGAFTREGRDSIEGRFESLTERPPEDWVLGEGAALAVTPEIAADLRDRYEAEAVARWTAFLEGVEYMPIRDVDEGARALQALSREDSPIVELLRFVESQTAGGPDPGAPEWPGLTDAFSGLLDANDAFVQEMAGLYGSLATLAQGDLSDPGLRDQISQLAEQANQAFGGTTWPGRTRAALYRLFTQPFATALELADDARFADLSTFTDCGTCPEMVVIPGGTFVMGSPEGEEGQGADEGPQHRVSVPRFALAKHEVTVGEYRAFVASTGRSWGGAESGQTGGHPAVNVSWDDAQAYVGWLSEQSGVEYRLPSEAEWEYAARAGTTAARYWGEDASEACAYANVGDSSYGCEDGHARTAPVGSYRANAFGLQDMLGNVSEWVEDCWHGDYNDAPRDGTAWTTGCANSRRVLRGGSWYDVPGFVRSASRSGSDTDGRVYDLGFRVARSLP